MEDIIDSLNKVLVQTRVFHYNVLDHNDHIKLGNLYDTLSEGFDRLIEGFIALKREDETNKDITYMFQFSEITLIPMETKEKILTFYYKVYSNVLNSKSSLDSIYKGLENIIDDICEMILNFIYLFRLQ